MINNKTNEKRYFGVFLILACAVGVINVLFYTDYTISLTVVIIECAVLTYFFLRNKIGLYLSCYLIFLCLSLESEKFLNESYFYGFKNFRIMGLNLGIIFLIPICIKYLNRLLSYRKKVEVYSNLIKFRNLVFVLSASGVILGIINNLIMNDNNITNVEGYLSEFLSVFYVMAVIPLLLVAAIMYIIKYERESIQCVKDAIVAVLCGAAISIIVSLFKGNYGSIGGLSNTTLVVSLVIFYIPFLILAPFYKENHYTKVQKWIIFIFGSSSTIIAIIYNANGKILLMVLLLPILLVIIEHRLHKPGRVLLLLFGILLAGFAFISLNLDTSSNWLLHSKMEQVISFLKFWEPNWLQEMEISPRYRIVEFINICVEYSEKPWMALLGKGYLGSIKDHINMLVRVGGDFTNVQWANGTFYLLHESINLLFLNNGLLGLFAWIYAFKLLINNFHKSFYLLFGCSWFLLTFGYSVTISALGMTAIMIGLYDIDMQQINKNKQCE